MNNSKYQIDRKYHDFGFDYTGDKMLPLRPLKKDVNEPKETKAELVVQPKASINEWRWKSYC
jgi:hypothetical protein